jgi:uncharacterized membrane protein
LPGLVFDPENGGDMLLRNVSKLPDYTAGDSEAMNDIPRVPAALIYRVWRVTSLQADPSASPEENSVEMNLLIQSYQLTTFLTYDLIKLTSIRFRRKLIGD